MSADHWITVWCSFGSAVIGGLIAVVAAFLANRQAHGYDRKLAEAGQKEKIDGILHAMRHELDVLNRHYQDTVGEPLSKVEAGKPFTLYIPLSHQNFIIYPNNTEIVGQIEDLELCKAIITTYSKANSFIDIVGMNNMALLRISDLDVAFRQTGKPEIKGAFDGYWKESTSYVSKIKEAHEELKCEAVNLIKRIDDYRQRHQIGAAST